MVKMHDAKKGNRGQRVNWSIDSPMKRFKYEGIICEITLYMTKGMRGVYSEPKVQKH